MEHALRQTLVADALSLQFKLPPPGEPAPAARSSAAVAAGSPVVDAVAVTSVWAVHLLRTLCQVGLWQCDILQRVAKDLLHTLCHLGFAAAPTLLVVACCCGWH